MGFPDPTPHVGVEAGAASAQVPTLQPGPAPGVAWGAIGAYAFAAAGLVVVLVGVWMLWWPKREAADGGSRWARVMAWRATRTEATRLVLGLCAVLVGYHMAAYALPSAWLPLRVPIERWWLLAGGVVVAIAASLRMDAWEARDERLRVDARDASKQ